jgi:hypothetical protein
MAALPPAAIPARHRLSRAGYAAASTGIAEPTFAVMFLNLLQARFSRRPGE